MIKFKEFLTQKNYPLDKQLTDFVESNYVEIIDIKYQVLLDTSYDIIMSFALVQYKDLKENGE